MASLALTTLRMIRTARNVVLAWATNTSKWLRASSTAEARFASCKRRAAAAALHAWAEETRGADEWSESEGEGEDGAPTKPPLTAQQRLGMHMLAANRVWEAATSSLVQWSGEAGGGLSARGELLGELSGEAGGHVELLGEVRPASLPPRYVL
ncbi:hypothetical protein T484DRAFT_1759697 [Baffinella frigidus]|nr:hypothetical protein T484DRAFT_1759697 [Cryptophyta sp. CCMP2293]